MDSGIPYTHGRDAATADYIRWVLRERKKASIAESSEGGGGRQLAMDATPMGKGRARLERGTSGER